MAQTTLTYYDPNYPTTIAPGFIMQCLDDETYSYVQRYHLLQTKPEIKLIARTITPSPFFSSTITNNNNHITNHITAATNILITHNHDNSPSPQFCQPPPPPPPAQKLTTTPIHRSIPIRLATHLFENYELVIHEDEGLIMYITLPDERIDGMGVLDLVVWVMGIVQMGRITNPIAIFGGGGDGGDVEGCDATGGRGTGRGGKKSEKDNRELERRLSGLKKAVCGLGGESVGRILFGDDLLGIVDDDEEGGSHGDKEEEEEEFNADRDRDRDGDEKVIAKVDVIEILDESA